MDFATSKIEFPQMYNILSGISDCAVQHWQPLFTQLFSCFEEDNEAAAINAVDTAMRAQGVSFGMASASTQPTGELVESSESYF